MKKEDITTLGIAEDIADKLLAALSAELTAANTQRDGWKTKYEAESAAFAAHKTDTALMNFAWFTQTSSRAGRVQTAQGNFA
ncbi:MAG: hypothetical protein LBK41_03185 [Clostridiales bacterium]|jgi:hypothetical protein|nr:hypothetical protein [Clostridiales bacterium]